MKLQYKISLVMMTVSIAILAPISYLYSELSYKSVMENEKHTLTTAAVDSARYIEHELLDKLSNAKTLAAAPIVENSLINSNNEYETLSDEQKKEHISKLNTRWMQAESADDIFIKPYLNNELALYLKKQQSVLKGIYGELFITNRHGAMIATTGKLTTLAHANKYWWRESYASGDGKVFFDDRGFDKSVGGYVIGVVIPIKKDGEIIGILKANVNIIEALSKVIQRYDGVGHGSLKVVRTKGKIVYAEGLTPLSATVDSKILKNLQNMETGSSLIEDSTKNEIMAYAPIRLSLDSKDAVFGGKSRALDHTHGNDGEIWHTVICYNKELALYDSKEINKLIIYIGLAIAFISGLIAFTMGRLISKPIDELSKVFHSIADGNYDLRAEISSKNEIGKLAESFNYMLDELSRTTASRDELRQEIEKRQEVEAEQKQQEEIMIAQSRHAAMGEMVSMLAHQWRQPISAISMGANNILADVELETVDEENLKKGAQSILVKTNELSKIIDDFRGFFKEEKVAKEITADEVIADTIGVIGKSLESNKIEIITEIKSKRKINTYPKELMQVIINILKNSKEVIEDNCSDIKEVKISIYDKDNSLAIKICDSGGGIKDEIINKIFDPYFTTKGVHSGVGLGLYMSKTIVEKHLHGELKCYNEAAGACFEMILPLDIKEERL